MMLMFMVLADEERAILLHALRPEGYWRFDALF